VVAFDHRAYGHLDRYRRDRISKVRVAGVDPIDLNPVGSEIIHVTRSVGGIVPLPKGVHMKTPGEPTMSLPDTNAKCRHHRPMSEFEGKPRRRLVLPFEFVTLKSSLATI
jgi:hypothetical protein